MASPSAQPKKEIAIEAITLKEFGLSVRKRTAKYSLAILASKLAGEQKDMLHTQKIRGFFHEPANFRRLRSATQNHDHKARFALRPCAQNHVYLNDTQAKAGSEDQGKTAPLIKTKKEGQDLDHVFCIEILGEDLQQVPRCLTGWTSYPMFGVGTGVSLKSLENVSFADIMIG